MARALVAKAVDDARMMATPPREDDLGARLYSLAVRNQFAPGIESRKPCSRSVSGWLRTRRRTTTPRVVPARGDAEDRQAAMTLPEMLDDLPTDCSVGMKKDSKGYKSTWVGYKLHIDVADDQIPISWCAVRRRHSSAGANPARQLSLQPVAVRADDGGNDIG